MEKIPLADMVEAIVYHLKYGHQLRTAKGERQQGIF